MTDKTNPYNVPTTGHVWDDNLAELTNPPPKWWMLGLHASWILVAVYGLFYPMWPGITSHTKGVFMEWTAIGEYKQDLEKLEEVRKEHEDKVKVASVDQILADSNLKEYTKNSAKVLFGDNCAACHGSAGQGNPNFPNLLDDDWLYGNGVDNITETITKGRAGMMTAHDMPEAELTELATKIAEGKPTETPLFQAKGCFACHGMDGKGLQGMGSANLTDKIWRFGNGSVADIKYTIKNGVNAPGNAATRNAQMPTFGDKLSETDIKKLVVYVRELGAKQ